MFFSREQASIEQKWSKRKAVVLLLSSSKYIAIVEFSTYTTFMSAFKVLEMNYEFEYDEIDDSFENVLHWVCIEVFIQSFVDKHQQQRTSKYLKLREREQKTEDIFIL